jgi:hypothetical protein
VRNRRFGYRGILIAARSISAGHAISEADHARSINEAAYGGEKH